MSAKLVFLVGVLGVGGYAGHKMMNYDAAVFPYSKEQVQTMLTEAETRLPRRDGDGEIRIWSTGRSREGVSLAMQYASWAPKIDCEAVVTAVAENESRVVADCGGDPHSDSALARTQDELRAPMFEEHIQATLRQREFHRELADSKERAIAMKNMGAMQREALKRSDEMQRMMAENRP